eukprot:13562074-Ditylum_brightwellii.AAC.1
MERSMQNKHVVDDNGGGVGNSDDDANKYLTHLSQAFDCCLTERSKQNMCAVGNIDDGVDDSVDN